LPKQSENALFYGVTLLEPSNFFIDCVFNTSKEKGTKTKKK